MRVQLSGLFRRVLRREGRAAESLRARRQSNRQHLQVAAPRIGALADRQGRDDPGGCRCYGCAGRRAGPLARWFR